MSTISDSLVEELKTSLSESSSVVTPGTDAYAQAIKRWSDAAEKKAAIVVYPESAKDVATAIQFSQANSLDLAVCCGGHSTGGTSSTEGGLCVNLDKMRAVKVDPEKMTITAQGGALWADVDKAAGEHGLATVGGTINHTGIGGLTLGGGYGWLTPAYGLTIDNLLEVEYVLADGRIVTASETTNPDLFWAARGAGSCFGVATSLTYRAHRQENQVWAGSLVFPPTALASVIQFANRQAENPTGKHAMVVAFAAPPPAFQPCVICGVFYNGSENEAMEVFGPLLELEPLANTVSMIPYPSLNAMLNAIAGHGGRKSWKGAAFLTPLDIPFIQGIFDDFCAFIQKVPEAGATMLLLEYLDSRQLNKVAPSATAFANRGNFCNVMIGPHWQTADADDVCRGWSREMAAKFKAEMESKKSVGQCTDKNTMEAVGQYANYDGLGRTAKEVFGINTERLVSIKKQYDPQNVFYKWVNLLPVMQ